MKSRTNLLRDLLKTPEILLMPGCFDAMSAKLIQEAGFPVGFMSGFCVSAAKLAMPDTGLISYGELVAHGSTVCNAVTIPMFGDGDTGFGNGLNIKRTVHGYAQAGFSCILIEDQVAPKRCGHTKGKVVASQAEAFMRIKAAVDAKNEGADILIMARTDARTTHGLDEAILRCNRFRELGADITFLEAPETVEEMKLYCKEVAGPKMANMIEYGKTPILSPDQLQEIGYKIVVYPLTTLNATIKNIRDALRLVKEGKQATNIMNFEDLKDVVGFNEYYTQEEKYKF